MYTWHKPHTFNAWRRWTQLGTVSASGALLLVKVGCQALGSLCFLSSPVSALPPAWSSNFSQIFLQRVTQDGGEASCDSLAGLELPIARGARRSFSVTFSRPYLLHVEPHVQYLKMKFCSFGSRYAGTGRQLGKTQSLFRCRVSPQTNDGVLFFLFESFVLKFVFKRWVTRAKPQQPNVWKIFKNVRYYQKAHKAWGSGVWAVALSKATWRQRSSLTEAPGVRHCVSLICMQLAKERHVCLGRHVACLLESQSFIWRTEGEK